jgi:hypothetical protein
MEPTDQKPADRDPYLWKQAKARVGFRMHLRTYLIINSTLWIIWAVTSVAFRSPSHWGFIFPWPIFPTLGWGIGLASHYFGVYRGGSEKDMIEREYQKLTSQQR